MTPRFPSNFWSESCDSPRSERPDDASPVRGPHLDYSRFPAADPEEPADSPQIETNSDMFGRNVAFYLPDSYEPNYAYPLIVWLHGDGSRETELADVMPQISEQNYLGLAFRGPLPAKDGLPFGFRWLHSDRAVSDFLDPLYETVCLLRREYHVHSERIYLAGFDGGANLALKLLLRRPEWFGGAIALGGRFPSNRMPLTRFRELTGKSVLFGCGSRDEASSMSQTLAIGRLLHSAGMEVATRVYEGAHELTPEILSHVNHWLMEGICASVHR